MSENILAIKLFNDGVAAFLRNEFKASIKYFSQALKHDRNFSLVYSSRGAAQLKINKIEKAISDFTRAIRLDPSYARAFHLRGLAYEKASLPCRATLQKSRVRTPGGPLCWLFRQSGGPA